LRKDEKRKREGEREKTNLKRRASILHSLRSQRKKEKEGEGNEKRNISEREREKQSFPKKRRITTT